MELRKRAYNFSAGPAALPEPVLAKIQGELFNWRGTGASVLEASHRSACFIEMAEQMAQDLRDLLHIPDNYQVLFLQGGGAQQFSQIPMNLVREARSCDYIDTPAYLHYTTNETIDGLEFHWIPDIGEETPLIADFPANILSGSQDVSRFGLIYAGAQKNIGPSGMTLVIVREDPLDHAHPYCPDILSYRVIAEHGSMYNTPSTLAWSASGLSHG